MRNRSRSVSFILQHKDMLTIVLVTLSLLISVLNVGTSTRYVLTTGKEVESPELERFCTTFVSQIISKQLHKEMVESDIYGVLTQDNYAVLKLAGHERTLFSRSNDNKCAVIVKDKLGLRRFELWVNKSFDYPFFYKIQKIDELGLEG